jgi:hypothetical protein
MADGAGPVPPPPEGTPAPAGEGAARETRTGRALGTLLGIISPNVVLPAADRSVDRIVHGVAGRGTAGSRASRLAYAIGLASMVWHRISPKRLRLTFDDGSRLAFQVPIAADAGPARRIAAALA